MRSILEKDVKGEIQTHDFKKWQTAFVHTTLFLPLQHQTFRYSYQGTVEDVIDRVFSAKVMGLLSEKERAEMIIQVKAILATHPDTQGKTTFAIPYRVEMYWTELR